MTEISSNAQTNTISPPQPSSCAACQKVDVSLLRCAKCQTTQYCSRECQKADWKDHKQHCPSYAAAALLGHGTGDIGGQRPPKGLLVYIQKPFTRLDNGTWLHDRPEQDVYKLLVDSYRFRSDDCLKAESEADPEDMRKEPAKKIVGFKQFLESAASREGLLPTWWDGEKEKACQELAVRDKWSNLAIAADKDEISDHYGDPLMPVQLRIFAETVIPKGSGSQEAVALRQMMMRFEQCGDERLAAMMQLNQGRSE